MSNWTSLTINDLKDSGHGAIIDAAQSTAVGQADPVSRIIADVVARIRAAIASGNQLDLDPTKIPNSLKDLAARMAVRLLKQRIEYPQTKDEQDQRNEDRDYLKQIYEGKIQFESPDTPGGSAEIQTAGNLEQTSGNAPVMTRDRMEGLL